MGTSDIIIGGAVLYKAPVGEAIPDETTIGYGTAWGGNWTKYALTNTPIVAKHEQETYDVKIEQSTLPLKRVAVNEDFMIETTLVEITASNLNLVANGTVTTTAAGASQVGYEDLDFGGEVQLDESAWGIEGLHIDSSGNSHPVRLFLYKGTATINGDLSFAKGAEMGIPLQIKALADLSQSAGQQLAKFQRVTAVATA